MHKKVLPRNKIILGNISCIWSNNYEKKKRKKIMFAGFFGDLENAFAGNI